MVSDLISVMMPVYNGEKYLRQAIDSLLAQSYRNWELIVVDDGSTDRTAAVLADFDDPRIRVSRQENMGEASARNRALELIQGEFLAFLDADDQFLPDHLQLTRDFLAAHPEFDAVYTDGYYMNEESIKLKPLSSRRRGPFQGDIFEEVMRSSDVFGAPLCVVLRSTVIHNNKLTFDTGIIIGPDWDFLTQYAQVATFASLTQLTCLYRVHQTNISLRTGHEKRIRSLTRCREKIIKMERFEACSPEVRSFVFYDLLIELFRGDFERQAEIVKWPEFHNLPKSQQSRLLRLMASGAILSRQGESLGANWLRQARVLNAGDLQLVVLFFSYSIHPGLCKLLIRLKNLGRPENKFSQPFADLMEK